LIKRIFALLSNGGTTFSYYSDYSCVSTPLTAETLCIVPASGLAYPPSSGTFYVVTKAKISGNIAYSITFSTTGGNGGICCADICKGVNNIIAASCVGGIETRSCKKASQASILIYSVLETLTALCFS
jgi:hypothetical protein